MFLRFRNWSYLLFKGIIDPASHGRLFITASRVRRSWNRACGPFYIGRVSICIWMAYRNFISLRERRGSCLLSDAFILDHRICRIPGVKIKTGTAGRNGRGNVQKDFNLIFIVVTAEGMALAPFSLSYIYTYFYVLFFCWKSLMREHPLGGSRH